MKVIGELDTKDYQPGWPVFLREAVRAMIFRGDQIAMVYSEAEHYYKFPGGGIEPGESHLEALLREVREETGLRIRPETVREYGMVREKRKSTMEPEKIFEQRSCYYTAEVEAIAGALDLDDYEAELGYHLVWTDLPSAYEANLGRTAPVFDFLRREAYVLGLLLQEQNGNT